jgi:hypothetical protein
VTDDQAEWRQSFEALREAHAQAVAAVEGVPDAQRAFEAATELVAVTDALVGDSAAARARMVRRIWEAEKLSLAALATRIGVSKSRADQFIRAARTDDPAGAE